MSDIYYRETMVDVHSSSSGNWIIAGIVVVQLLVAAALYVNGGFDTSGIMVDMPKAGMTTQDAPATTG